ncbi:hypothetical protein NDU88_006697 [Pleurodeles waltl]|uniref:Uncharacterized protein n=1 Tax=Pleurodeles waltl TaxID=8319 RepID=A0AAV7SQC0_PLEWA|nr:hypothetical protein NDU88_006697 [Pleurodeles waltl]
MAGTRGHKGSTRTLASGGGQRTKAGTGAPAPGLPELWPGAWLGPLNSNQKGKPPWARRTPRPGPLGVQQAEARDRLPQGLVGDRLGPLNPNMQGKPPRARLTPRPGPLGVQQAEATDRPPQGPVGDRLGPLNPNRQGKPPRARWAPRSGPLRVQQSGGRECPLQGTVRARAQLGLSEHYHAEEASRDPSPGALPHGGPEDKAQARGSHPGVCHNPGWVS